MQVSRSTFGLAVACVLVLCGGCGGSASDEDLSAGVAAKVGDEVIPESAVRRQLNAFYAVRRTTAKASAPPAYAGCMAGKREAQTGDSEQTMRRQCRIEYELARAQRVNALVHSEWLTREARRRGLNPRRVVEKALARANALRVNTFGSEPMLDSQKLALRIEALNAKLLAVVPLAEAEIKEYAQANADVFLEAEKRVAQVLQTMSKAKAERAVDQLHRGATWLYVQNRYGVKPFSTHWTGRQTVAKNTAPHDAFGRTLFSAKPKTIVGPIRTLNGWFVLEVLTVKPPRHPGLSPQARSHIVAALRVEKLGQALRRRYVDRTRCAARYAIPEAPDCSDL